MPPERSRDRFPRPVSTASHLSSRGRRQHPDAIRFAHQVVLVPIARVRHERRPLPYHPIDWSGTRAVERPPVLTDSRTASRFPDPIGERVPVARRATGGFGVQRGRGLPQFRVAVLRPLLTALANVLGRIAGPHLSVASSRSTGFPRPLPDLACLRDAHRSGQNRTRMALTRTTIGSTTSGTSTPRSPAPKKNISTGEHSARELQGADGLSIDGGLDTASGQ